MICDICGKRIEEPGISVGCMVAHSHCWADAASRDTVQPAIPRAALEAVIAELETYHHAHMKEAYHERWGDLSTGRADGARYAISLLHVLLNQGAQS